MELAGSKRSDTNLDNAFKAGIALNLIFIIIEIYFGLRANSMALISDAGHNFSDVVILVFSWIAVSLSLRKPTLKYTYGFRRSTILIALLNTLILVAAVIIIVWRTIVRLRNPVNINSEIVIITASAGIVINGVTAWLFMKGQKNDLNIRSAFIHFFADALVSFGVVIAGIIIALTGLLWVDSLLSFIISVIIIYSSINLLIKSTNLALDAVPEDIDINNVTDYLQSQPEVTAIHDLHIWALSTTETALTVHIMTNKQTDMSFISRIQSHLKEHFGLVHTTIQVEFGDNPEGCNNCN